MEERGFVQDIFDVKVLALYVLARVQRPVTLNKLYELCFQDDRLSFFDLCEAMPQMVETGHVAELEENLFEITESGREIQKVLDDNVAYPVAQRAKAAVEKFNHEARRSSFLHTELIKDLEGGEEVVVRMELLGEKGKVMSLEVAAPNITQARRIEKKYRQRAEKVYKAVLEQLLSGPDEG